MTDNIHIYNYTDDKVDVDAVFSDNTMKSRITTHLGNNINGTVYIYKSEVLKALIYIDKNLNPGFKFNNKTFSGGSFFQIFYVKMLIEEPSFTNDVFIDFVKSLTSPDDAPHKITFIICSGKNELSGITPTYNGDYQFSKIASNAKNTKIDQSFSLPNNSELNYIVITMKSDLNQLKESKQEEQLVVSEQAENQSQQQAEGQLVLSEQPEEEEEQPATSEQAENQSQQPAEGQLVLSEQPATSEQAEKQPQQQAEGQPVLSEQPEEEEEQLVVSEQAEHQEQQHAEEARVADEKKQEEEEEPKQEKKKNEGVEFHQLNEYIKVAQGEQARINQDAEEKKRREEARILQEEYEEEEKARLQGEQEDKKKHDEYLKNKKHDEYLKKTKQESNKATLLSLTKEQEKEAQKKRDTLEIEEQRKILIKEAAEIAKSQGTKGGRTRYLNKAKKHSKEGKRKTKKNKGKKVGK